MSCRQVGSAMDYVYLHVSGTGPSLGTCCVLEIIYLRASRIVRSFRSGPQSSKYSPVCCSHIFLPFANTQAGAGTTPERMVPTSHSRKSLVSFTDTGSWESSTQRLHFSDCSARGQLIPSTNFLVAAEPFSQQISSSCSQSSHRVLLRIGSIS
jgi:hypothetical protein